MLVVWGRILNLYLVSVLVHYVGLEVMLGHIMGKGPNVQHSGFVLSGKHIH